MSTPTPKPVKLVAVGPGLWETEDGRGMVSLDSTFETECDEPHPVRMRVDALASFSDWYRNSLLARGQYKIGKTKAGWVEYLTYQCQGGETHFYSMWTVRVDEEWTDNVYYTFKEARSALEDALGQPVVLQRRRPSPSGLDDPPASV